MSEELDGTLSWWALWTETATRLGDRVHARWICEEASGAHGAEWIGELDTLVGQRAVARVDAMVARRLAGEPLQYVLGSWPFRTVELAVDRRVLIPRPETEEVAGIAIEFARQAPMRPRRLVDLGTGCGAIALAAAAELPIDGTEVWAVEYSPDATAVARANLAGLGRPARNVRLIEGSWFDPLPAELRGEFDVVVANPPYISDDSPDVAADVREWEPASALFSGPDGLNDLRHIIGAAPGWLRPGSGRIVLEIGADQGADASRLLASCGFADVEIRPDAAGLDRVAVARRPE